jgi:Ca2+-binding EF-hand superfamily protein
MGVFEELFAELDVNNDGMLSLSELKVGLRLSSLDEAEQLFSLIDDNSDRRITCEEFVAFVSDPSSEFFTQISNMQTFEPKRSEQE